MRYFIVTLDVMPMRNEHTCMQVLCVLYMARIGSDEGKIYDRLMEIATHGILCQASHMCDRNLNKTARRCERAVNNK